ncbi:hypothetical protein TorRG33x02_098630 [Trema orientale]|uniref:Uncharacterized protein n=1 Tax=Trema orientale TaxID=63057 RepID=A0A2P5F9B3_TREOI|nr:hypothetical protein TorRG33x02_098630 [Trema orientale]
MPKLAEHNCLGQVGHAGGGGSCAIAITTTGSFRIPSLRTQIPIVMDGNALIQVVRYHRHRRLRKPGGHQIPQCHSNRKEASINRINSQKINQPRPNRETISKKKAQFNR